MKIWTYQEAADEVMRDLDLQDETFISPDELAGHFNKGLADAQSEILALNQDYLLTKSYVPVVQGVNTYETPENMYANKIRGMVFKSGSTLYPISRFRRQGKFEEMAFVESYAPNDWYKYNLVNDNVGASKIQFYPTMRDTAVLAPAGTLVTPITLWYIRNCSRIPMLGEYCNREVIAPSQVDATANTIQTYAGTTTIGTVQLGTPGGAPGSIVYITGDKVKFKTGPGGTLPGGLVEGTVYYVIALGSGSIKVATTLANASLGTAIDLTTTGTVYFTMTVAATKPIRNATLLDIPEFTDYVIQWAKVCCVSKEGDPRIEAEALKLVAKKKQMVDTLTESVPDDDDIIQGDFSHYEEMS